MIRNGYILLLIIFGTLSVITTFGQENSVKQINEAVLNGIKEIDKPVLFQEFGVLNSENLTSRMFELRDALKNNPAAKGYIVIFRGEKSPFASPIRFGVRLKNYLIEHLGINPERFQVINGGLSREFKTQLWLAPKDNQSPLFSPIREQIDLSKSFLFDDLEYPGIYDGEGCCAIDGYTEEAKQASLEAFAKQVKENTNAVAYLIAYGQYCTDCSHSAVWSRNGKYLGTKPDIYLDSAKTITGILKKEKDYLVNRYHITPSKIIIINGGYQESRALELWLVPQNGEKPKPKPTTFPPKRKKKVMPSR